MRRISFLTLASASALLLCSSALAQESVPVRVGHHGDYTRLVFDWQTKAGYKIKKEQPDRLTLMFSQAASLKNVSSLPTKSHVKSVDAYTESHEPLAVHIGIKPNSKIRDFRIGNKVIIDVFGKTEVPAVKPPEKVAQKKTPVTENKPEVSMPKLEVEVVVSAPVEAEVEQAAPALDVSTLVVPPAAELGTAVVEEESKTLVETAMDADVEPYILTFSTTEAVGVASFIRGDNLWFVVDRSRVKIPPEISGKNKDKFPKFQRYDLESGTAFRTTLRADENWNIYGEGGGLVWRLVITKSPRDITPVNMERSFSEGEMIRGGTASWSIQEVTRVLDVPDPFVGDVLKVVTVAGASQLAGSFKSYVDFDVLASQIGMAIQPKADDLKIEVSPIQTQLGRPGGLALSRTKDIKRRNMRKDIAENIVAPLSGDMDSKIRRIFDFDRWMMGGKPSLAENQRILMGAMAAKDRNGRVQDLLTLAKMNLANDRGQEAIGFLTYAAQELPSIAKGAEYHAIRGAAYALAGKPGLALKDFSDPALSDYTELDYWRAYVLAGLEDWQQAEETLPSDYSVLVDYPKELLEKIGLKLAEIALRSGDVQGAESILVVLQKDAHSLRPWTLAGMDYLKGEAHRQSKEYELARALWEPLTQGHDDFYRARAGMAYTLLEMETGDATRAQGIDRLEGLRYAWRGDELEAQINFMLGRLYLDDRRFVKGFGILREAATMSPDSDISHDITGHMAASFQTILMEDPELTPLEAVTIYEEFTELTPPGDDGNKLVQKLADRLVEAELMNRATNILQHQIDYRLKGLERARVAKKLAAIYLLDNLPSQALKAINVARDDYKAANAGGIYKGELFDLELMSARALSQAGKTEEALALLALFDPSPAVNRLRADISWQAGLWEDAAEALQDLILDEALDPKRPLTTAQSELILNRAVTLNLSGNRVALINMRKRYGNGMRKTARSKLFDVITRPRQSAMLADRETLESIVSEVDIFKDFLENYRDEGSTP